MPEINYIRLSELGGKINEAIHGAFGNIGFWVIADITNHSFREQKNYHHFELVEKDPGSSQIRARMTGKAWGNGAASIKQFEQVTGQRFGDHIQVLLRVAVQYHPVYGLQLDMLDIDPNFTLGALAQQRQATLERLLTENPDHIQKSGDRYITRNNRLKIGAVIQKIALISSKTSAGAEDFKHTLEHNSFGYRFYIDDYFTAVQGEANAEEFLSKILEVFHSGKPYDAVVITRGGGAQTDFLIFDNYRIGRAIARFPIPVITGIGHQKNESIVDLMAHTQTKTPTKAAEFIIAHNKNYADVMMALQHQIIIRSQQLFSRHFQALAALNSTVVNQTRNILAWNKDGLNSISFQMLSKPKIVVYNRIKDIQQMIRQLGAAQGQYLKNQTGYLNHYGSVIRLMAPDNILKKGFAIVKIDGQITSNPGRVTVGKEMEVILSGTAIKSTVIKKSEYDGSDFNL